MTEVSKLMRFIMNKVEVYVLVGFQCVDCGDRGC